MEVTYENIWKLIELYFRKKNILVEYIQKSFEDFIENIVYRELKNGDNIIMLKDDRNNKRIIKYYISFDNIKIIPPHDSSNNILFPEQARKKLLTYASKLVADAKFIQESYYIDENIYFEKIIEEEKDLLIGKIPIPIKSKYCSTNIYKNIKNTECPYDFGAYWIIKGQEKVILSQEVLNLNNIFVFKKEQKDKIFFSCQINSNNKNVNVNKCKIELEYDVSKNVKENKIVVNTPNFKDVQLIIILKALGLEDDKIIMMAICNNDNDLDMKLQLEKMILLAKKEEILVGNKTKNILTQKDALNYLQNKIVSYKKLTKLMYQKSEDKIHIIKEILISEFMPHINNYLPKDDGILFFKAINLCIMANKLLNCYLERQEIYDRDDYTNKIIETPGEALGPIFKQNYRKMFNDLSKHFERKNKDNDENPIQILKILNPGIMEKGLNTSIASGNWGATEKKGVAQTLKWPSLFFGLAHIRRITLVPSIDVSNKKIIRMRHVSGQQYGYICPVESPDGENAGLIKHLTTMATITHNLASQDDIILDIIKNIDEKETGIKLFNITNNIISELKKYVKIYLNGSLLYLTNTPNEFYNFMRKKKNNGMIHIFVGVSYNYLMKEIKINTSSGRLIRPVLVVENNKLNLTGEILNKITENMTWNEFLTTFPNVVEYRDIEEINNDMICMYFDDVKKK